jgi:hypothetical protein
MSSSESRRHALSHTSLPDTIVGEPEEHYPSGSTKRWRETVESIPSPEEYQGRRPKRYVSALRGRHTCR